MWRENVGISLNIFVDILLLATLLQGLPYDPFIRKIHFVELNENLQEQGENKYSDVLSTHSSTINDDLHLLVQRSAWMLIDFGGRFEK